MEIWLLRYDSDQNLVLITLEVIGFIAMRPTDLEEMGCLDNRFVTCNMFTEEFGRLLVVTPTSLPAV